MSKSAQSQVILDDLQDHYDDYPFPFREPEDDRSRLVSFNSEYLEILNQWLFRGKEGFNAGFRVLIAGGGTGDSAIFLAEQLKNAKAEIVYIDLSKASMEIAQKRAEIRGLKNIRWILDSITNIPNLNLGSFDYINCLGVIIALDSPLQNLKILKNSLTDKGGMQLLVYGKYGRTAVNHLQDLMQIVNYGVKSKPERIMYAKQILTSLPETNWFMHGHNLRGTDLISLFRGDGGIYEELLQGTHNSYSIPELHELVKSADLNFVEYADAADRVNLRIEQYVKDISLLNRIKGMNKTSQQAICEIMMGNMSRHTIYASNQKDARASLSDLNNVPYFFNLNNAPQSIYETFDSSVSGKCLSVNLRTSFIENLDFSILLSQYTKSIFKNMIGEDKCLKEIFEGVRKDLSQDISDPVLIDEVKRVLTPFIEAGVLVLRDKSIHAINYGK